MKLTREKTVYLCLGILSLDIECLIDITFKIKVRSVGGTKREHEVYFQQKLSFRQIKKGSRS